MREYKGLTRTEWVFVAIAVVIAAVIVMGSLGWIQPYGHGIQLGYVFIDWHYLVDEGARAELG